MEGFEEGRVILIKKKKTSLIKMDIVTPRYLLIILVSLSSCSHQREKEVKLGSPFDSINHIVNYNSGTWKVQYTDSIQNAGDSLMYYKNDTLAKIIHFIEDRRVGFLDVSDSLGNWTIRYTYAQDTLTIGVKVVYPKTGLIDYNYHLVKNKPIGVYRQFYNHYHDSIFLNGYIYARSTRLKEYRLYDINNKVWFRQEYFEDQSIKYDSGHSIIPVINANNYYLHKPSEVTIWVASPRETEEHLYIRNNQTRQIDTLLATNGEAKYAFIPQSIGYHRFTVFHNMVDTVNSTIRKDSITYRLEVIDE